MKLLELDKTTGLLRATNDTFSKTMFRCTDEQLFDFFRCVCEAIFDNRLWESGTRETVVLTDSVLMISWEFADVRSGMVQVGLPLSEWKKCVPYSSVLLECVQEIRGYLADLSKQQTDVEAAGATV